MFNTNSCTNTKKPVLTYRGAINVGDIVLIDNTKYICLYCDKSETVLCNPERGSINNIFVIPSKEKYYKIGVAPKEELVWAYGILLKYKGMFRNRSLDNIERTMKRVLDE